MQNDKKGVYSTGWSVGTPTAENGAFQKPALVLTRWLEFPDMKALSETLLSLSNLHSRESLARAVRSCPAARAFRDNQESAAGEGRQPSMDK